LRGRVREGASRSDTDTVDPDRPGDILERLLAEIVEGEVEPAGIILLNAG
jgi:hypothetical protein